jgi:signal transduction histidine kinase/Fe-S-cluster-containing hydrogenase component 2
MIFGVSAMSAFKTQLVSTIKDRCKMCYNCVRHCPAKAIRINEGQAEVISDRCIGCGNCVRVCTQKAKQIADSTWHAYELLENSHKVAVLIAPSFPAAFTEYDHTMFCGILKKLGFDIVVEVAFGADIVAKKYNQLYSSKLNQRLIESSCPGVVSYIQKYHPDLIKNLAPVISPMIAASRAVDAIYDTPYKKVFIGPCVAKKEEGACFDGLGGIDVVLTFKELEGMIEDAKILLADVQKQEFDEPKAALGRVYPLSHGFFQAAGIEENLLESGAISADGQQNFIEAIKEFGEGGLDVRLLELLCCQGCIMGAGIDSSLPMYLRHAKVSAYAKKGLKDFNEKSWQQSMDSCKNIDLTRVFKEDDMRMVTPTCQEITTILKQLGKTVPEDELNCGACGYASCIEHATAIHRGLAETAMCLPYTIEKLRTTVDELEESHTILANTREALMHSERLASMGQLAAGIAHEVNNPLGVILLYSHLLLEKTSENTKNHNELKMITQQTDRCKKIVSGLLNFARQNKVARLPVDLEQLINTIVESFKHHGRISFQVISELSNPVIEIDGDQITQVITNLITNGIDSMPNGGQLKVRLVEKKFDVEINVIDSGVGISPENIGKIFTPFFTTKKIGKGTGLGLAVSYGIVKMHSGQISAVSESNPDNGPTGTTFTVTLPKTEFAGDTLLSTG